jgi:hypothetical protein
MNPADQDLAEALDAARLLLERGERLPRYLEMALLQFRKRRLIRQEERLLGLAAPDQAGELAAPSLSPH